MVRFGARLRRARQVGRQPNPNQNPTAAHRLCHQHRPKSTSPNPQLFLGELPSSSCNTLPSHGARATSPLSSPSGLAKPMGTGEGEMGKGLGIHFAALPRGWIFKSREKSPRRTAGGRWPAGAMNKYPGSNQYGRGGAGKEYRYRASPPPPAVHARRHTHTNPVDLAVI